MANTLWRHFLNGLAVVLPVVVTVALLWWFVAMLERALGGAIRWVLPESMYFDGLGVLAGIVGVVAVGIATRVWLTRRLIALGEGLLERVPLAKSIYSSSRDLMRFVSEASDPSQMEKVVLGTLADGVRMVGFITQDGDAAGSIAADTDDVAVYLQMSYQMGGFTVFVPRDRVKPLDISLEEAMRWVLTAGMSSDTQKSKREE